MEQNLLSLGLSFIKDDCGQFGIVSSKARVDDQICLLKGAHMPCILRRRDTSGRTLISGTCWMEWWDHDISTYSEYKEAWQLSDEEEFQIW
jgi:hypothetical protein